MRPGLRVGLAAAAIAVALLAVPLPDSPLTLRPACHPPAARVVPTRQIDTVAGGHGPKKQPPLPPLWPLTPRAALTLLAAAAATALAAGGGMGGGGILVPLYLLLLGAPTRDAVALSNVTILGGALAAAAHNVPARHPQLDRPLVDWDVMLLMEPTTIVGAVLGGYLNRVSPSWATTTALTLLLMAITAQLTLRAVGLWRAETAAASAAAARPLLAAADEEAPAQRDPHADRRTVPAAKAAALAGLTLLVIASDEVKTRFTRCGSAGYWAAVGAVVPAALAVAAAARARVLKTAAAAPAAVAVADAPLHWTHANATLFPLLSTLAGVVAGAFGVGGGIVKGPILLELGVAPAVAAATSATMILFTSAAAAAVYVSFGAVRADYGAAFFGVGALFTAAGLRLVARAVAASGRRSLIIVTMAALLAGSALAAGYQAVVLTADVARRGAWGERGHVC